jgi:HAMP domain-containing protein
LRTVFLLAVLELGAISVVPMPLEKIRALMDSINRQKLAHTLPSEQRKGDGPAE